VGETQTITVNVSGDTVVEGNETLTATLGTASSSSVTSGAVGTGTITNDDTETLTISSPTVTEGNSGTTALVFTVTSPSAVQGGFTVGFTLADWTTDSSDHAVFPIPSRRSSGVVGETQTITVNVSGDTVVEGNET